MRVISARSDGSTLSGIKKTSGRKMVCCLQNTKHEALVKTFWWVRRYAHSRPSHRVRAGFQDVCIPLCDDKRWPAIVRSTGADFRAWSEIMYSFPRWKETLHPDQAILILNLHDFNHSSWWVVHYSQLDLKKAGETQSDDFSRNV